jgi:hypothetical protein
MVKPIHYLRTCVGNVSRIVPAEYVHNREQCETCGDYISVKCVVALVWADVDRPIEWGRVNPAGVGISWEDIELADFVHTKCPAPVWIVPHGFNVEDIDAHWGVDCD